MAEKRSQNILLYKFISYKLISQFKMRSIKRHLPSLLKLRKYRARDRKKFIEKVDDQVIHAICECAHNCLNSNIPLNTNQFRKLSRHKNTLRRLCKRGESIKKKRSIIKQTGGFLLPLLVPLLSYLIQNITS